MQTGSNGKKGENVTNGINASGINTSISLTASNSYEFEYESKVSIILPYILSHIIYIYIYKYLFSVGWNIIQYRNRNILCLLHLHICFFCNVHEHIEQYDDIVPIPQPMPASCFFSGQNYVFN